MSTQLTTFYVDGSLFGIDVLNVQEVAGKPLIHEVPLAPSFVYGLVNLRGQIATALGLRELFSAGKARSENQMSVICKIDGNLVALIVDAIGDVIEVNDETFEPAPGTLPAELRRYIKGIHKMNNELLSVMDLDVLAKELSPDSATATARP